MGLMEAMKKEALDLLSITREESLRGMTSENLDVRRAWYYTHMGEIEMAFNLGLITSEENDALHQEWREHCPSLTRPETEPIQRKGA